MRIARPLGMIPRSSDLPSAGIERIVLRPIGSPLPLGFIGFAVGAFLAAALTLHWIPSGQSGVVAAALLAFTAPVQLLACIVGFYARDTVAATAQGMLAVIWGTFGVILALVGGTGMLTGIGVYWLAAAFVAAMVAVASWSAGRFFAMILVVSAARYLLEGIADIGAGSGVSAASGLVGLVQAAMASYAGLALLIESSKGAPVLSLGRGAHGSNEEQTTAGLADASWEPGVRRTL